MIEIVGALLLTGAGIGLAWQAWHHRSRIVLAGAAIVTLAAMIVWCIGYGAEIGVPLAIETASVLALGFILSRTERRPDRAMRDREVPPVPMSGRYRLRGAARTAIAGPLGLAAAMGVAIAIAVRAPMVEQTRLILAGLIVPSLWAIFLVWAAATRRLTRTAGGFAVIAAAGFAVATIPRG